MRTRDHDGLLRHDEVRALADAAGDSPSRPGLPAPVAALYHACARLGVALRLTAPDTSTRNPDVRDADLTAACIHLRGRRDWQVPVDDATLGRLARWIACRASVGLGDGLMFCTSDGPAR